MQRKQSHHNCTHFDSKNEIEHIIHLLQHKFISPYRILYMIDQKQADLFKARNGDTGCCASSLISIPKADMSKLQSILMEVISRGYLLTHLESILKYCSQRYHNIVKEGQNSNLEITDDVQKYLLDKVLSEGLNLYLLQAVNTQIKRYNQEMKTGLGLWATPATWYSKFPNVPLNYLSSNVLYSLKYSGYGKCENFFGCKQNLYNQLRLLEKDGKFEQILLKDQLRNDQKLLNCAQMFISNENTKFNNLKQLVLSLKSIPFQLNAKTNSYCIISETVHISYFPKNGYHKLHKTMPIHKYDILMFFGGSASVTLTNKLNNSFTKIQIDQTDLIIIDSEKQNYSFQLTQKPYFVFHFWINVSSKIINNK